MNDQLTEFQPNFVPKPGVVLKEYLDARDIKVTVFAKRCGRPQKTISEIIAGNNSITPETAIQFERALDVKASIWLDLESRYQLFKAEEKERESLAEETDWIENFPYREMQNKGFLPRTRNPFEILVSMLKFFGVSTVAAWEDYWPGRLGAVRYKKSDRVKGSLYAVSAWLRRGEEKALDISCSVYDETKFRNALRKVRTLTMKDWPEARQDLIDLCRSAGVAVALVPDLSYTKIRGAAYWASKDKAVILLSDRLKFEERLWYAFFHEAAHILLHSKKTIFVDYEQDKEAKDIDEEREADDYAASAIISEDQLAEFYELYGRKKNSFTADELEEFARKIRISSALLLARLQWEGSVSYNRLTELRKPLVFQD